MKRMEKKTIELYRKKFDDIRYQSDDETRRRLLRYFELVEICNQEKQQKCICYSRS